MKNSKIKILKKYVCLVLVFVFCFSFGIATFSQEGRNDQYGGHFEQGKFYGKDGYAIKYCYYEGRYSGWELTFRNPVKWDDRYKLKRPFDIKSNEYGTWKKIIIPTKPPQTIKPTVSSTQTTVPPTSATISPTTSPTDSAVTSTSIVTVNPTATDYKTLPKTGESSNTIPFIFSLILVGTGVIILLKYKFSAAK